jgi:hypothetical protein
LLAPRAESEPAVIAAAPAPTPPAVEPEPPQAQDGSGVFTGNGLTPPDHKLSRDELRDFLKERARQVRGDAQPDTQPK